MSSARRPLTNALAYHFVWALALTVVMGSMGCSGRSLRSGVAGGPRLASARLGSLRSAMTYDGDWLGGASPQECLAEDFELAARRGVEVLVDLRAARYQRDFPLEELALDAGLDLVKVDLVDPRTAPGDDAAVDGREPSNQISDTAVDRVREILLAPGRRRTLLLDGDGTLSSMIYAVHLTVDEGVAEAEALRAARATGLSRIQEDFVKRQVDRIRSNSVARE